MKKNKNRINIRKTENINPLKNILNTVNLLLKSNPIDTHELLDFHLMLPQLGKTHKNKMNVIIVPMILRLFELISRLNK